MIILSATIKTYAALQYFSVYFLF